MRPHGWPRPLAYNTTFSLGPLLIIVVAISGLAFGDRRRRTSRSWAGWSIQKAIETVQGQRWIVSGVERVLQSAHPFVVSPHPTLWGAARRRPHC